MQNEPRPTPNTQSPEKPNLDPVIPTMSLRSLPKTLYTKTKRNQTPPPGDCRLHCPWVDGPRDREPARTHAQRRSASCLGSTADVAGQTRRVLAMIGGSLYKQTHKSEVEYLVI